MKTYVLHHFPFAHRLNNKKQQHKQTIHTKNKQKKTDNKTIRAFCFVALLSLDMFDHALGAGSLIEVSFPLCGTGVLVDVLLLSFASELLGLVV